MVNIYIIVEPLLFGLLLSGRLCYSDSSKLASYCMWLCSLWNGQLETQWKRKLEMENRNNQNMMQINVRAKPLINDHFLKITSSQRPHSN